MKKVCEYLFSYLQKQNILQKTFFRYALIFYLYFFLYLCIYLSLTAPSGFMTTQKIPSAPAVFIIAQRLRIFSLT